VAKSRTEILNSIKEKLENFKNNPLLNPDFSNTIEEESSSASIVLDDVIDDIQSVLDAMDEHTGIRELIEFNDRLEKEMLDAHEAMYGDKEELPSDFYTQTGIDGDDLPSSNPLEDRSV
jgi:hypothetical protein